MEISVVMRPGENTAHDQAANCDFWKKQSQATNGFKKKKHQDKKREVEIQVEFGLSENSSGIQAILKERQCRFL